MPKRYIFDKREPLRVILTKWLLQRLWNYDTMSECNGVLQHKLQLFCDKVCERVWLYFIHTQWVF